MITLYGNPYSPNTRKVHWALEEMGTPYTYRLVDLAKREQKSHEYMQLNPNGRVPTLDDDGFILWESNAILWYVADKLGRGVIVPEDVRERALIDQWSWWQYSDFSPAVARPWLMKFWARRGVPLDAARHAELVEAVQRPLALLDAHLADRTYVVGDRFSIADIALGEWTACCAEAEIDTTHAPHVNAWLARLAERPAFRKTRPGA
jgi:glutathione S-transferase